MTELTRVGVFGTFYPDFRYAGGSTTGMALASMLSTKIREVRVYAQRDSKLPECAAGSRLSVLAVWGHDAPLSLATALKVLVRDSPSLDVLVFNTYVTAFGRRALSNAVGMALPTAVALLSRRRPVVYMHNLVETQDIERLGYSADPVSRLAARLLERAMLRTCRVVVPLADQRRRIIQALGETAETKQLPYIEGVLSVLSLDIRHPPVRPHSETDPRLLIFGSIGPQKDLIGALSALNSIARSRGRLMRVTIAGDTNPAFASANGQLDHAMKGLHHLELARMGAISEEMLVPFLLQHEVALLPYHATGGQSGVLSLCALVGLDVIAYDHLQLREQAKSLGMEVRFIPKDSTEALEDALVRSSGTWGDRRIADPIALRARIERTVAAVETLLGGGDQPGNPVS